MLFPNDIALHSGCKIVVGSSAWSWELGDETRELENHKVTELGSHRAMESWSHRAPCNGVVEIQSQGITGPQSYGVTELWSHRAIESCNHEVTEP